MHTDPASEVVVFADRHGPGGLRQRLGRSMRGRQAGSVLMLLPAGVLILLMLGSVAVDGAIAFEDQRDLVALAQAAADDGAAVGVDVGHFRETGEIRLDADAVRRAIDRNIAARRDPAQPITVSWRIEGNQVVVDLRRVAPRLLTKAFPGGDRTVEARARSQLVIGR